MHPQDTGSDIFTVADFPEAEVVELKQGAVLYPAREAPEIRAFLLISGEMQVAIQGMGGRHTPLYVLSSGTLIGEVGFMAQEASLTVVEALMACRLLKIDEFVWRAVSCRPEFHRRLNVLLHRRLLLSHQAVRRLGQGKVLQRLGVYLLDLPQWRDAAVAWIDVRLPTHAMLARMLNCTRERITRSLQQLARSGCLEKKEGHLRIYRQCLIDTLKEVDRS